MRASARVGAGGQSAGRLFECTNFGGLSAQGIKSTNVARCNNDTKALHALLDECPSPYTPLVCGLVAGTSSFLSCTQNGGTAQALNTMALRLRYPHPNLQCNLGVLAATADCARAASILEQLVVSSVADPARYAQCKVWTASSTGTSSVSTTATRTATSTATSSATTTATTKGVYGLLKCVGLYSQQECFLSATDGLWETCTEQVAFLNDILGSCGAGADLLSCALIDGENVAVVSPTTPPTGVVIGAHTFGLAARSASSAYRLVDFVPGTDPGAYKIAFWDAESGDAHVRCPLVAAALSDAVAGLYRWRRSPTLRFSCALSTQLYSGMLSNSNVDSLNELIDAHVVEDFIGCNASTSTVTSTATTTAESTGTSTATTSVSSTASTTLGFAKFQCLRLFQIEVLSTSLGPGTCASDAAALNGMLSQCTDIVEQPNLGCSGTFPVYMSTPTTLCNASASALAQFVNSSSASVSCVATGFLGSGSQPLSIFAVSNAEPQGTCDEVATKLNQLLLTFTSVGSCTLSTTTTSSTSTSTSSLTKSTTSDATIYPSISLQFQLDTATIVTRTFASAVVSGMNLLSVINKALILECKIFDNAGATALAVVSFRTRAARDAMLAEVQALGLNVYYSGDLLVGVVRSGTVSTLAPTLPATKAPGPSSTLAASTCQAAVNTAVLSEESSCTGLLQRMSGKLSTTQPYAGPPGTQIELVFGADVKVILGNSVLVATVQTQLQRYLSKVAGSRINYGAITFRDDTPSVQNDPSGCICLLAVQKAGFSSSWSSCPASTAGLDAPTSLAEYINACNTVAVPEKFGPQMATMVTATSDQIRILTALAKDCVLCLSLEIGKAQYLCGRLAGESTRCGQTTVPTASAPAAVTQPAANSVTAALASTDDDGELYVGLLAGTAILLCLMVVLAAILIMNKGPPADALSLNAPAMTREQEMAALLGRLQGHIAAHKPAPQSASPDYNSPNSVMSTPAQQGHETSPLGEDADADALLPPPASSDAPSAALEASNSVFASEAASSSVFATEEASNSVSAAEASNSVFASEAASSSVFATEEASNSVFAAEASNSVFVTEAASSSVFATEEASNSVFAAEAASNPTSDAPASTLLGQGIPSVPTEAEKEAAAAAAAEKKKQERMDQEREAQNREREDRERRERDKKEREVRHAALAVSLKELSDAVMRYINTFNGDSGDNKVSLAAWRKGCENEELAAKMNGLMAKFKEFESVDTIFEYLHTKKTSKDGADVHAPLTILQIVSGFRSMADRAIVVEDPNEPAPEVVGPVAYIAQRAAHLAIDEGELSAGLAGLFAAADAGSLDAATLTLEDSVGKFKLRSKINKDKLAAVLRENALEQVVLGTSVNNSMDEVLQNIVADNNGKVSFQMFIDVCTPMADANIAADAVAFVTTSGTEGYLDVSQQPDSATHYHPPADTSAGDDISSWWN